MWWGGNTSWGGSGGSSTDTPPATGVNIAWNSEPDFDDWGPDSYWSCQDWITWHKALKEHYGAAQAKDIFLSKTDAGRSLFGHELTCSTFDPEFKKYFKDEGFESNIWDKGVDIINSGVDTVAGISDFVASVGRNMKKIVVGLVIIIAVVAAAYAYNKVHTAK